MTLKTCVLTFDTDVAVLRPVMVREHRRGEGNLAGDGTTSDVRGTFSYGDELRLTPTRADAIIAMLRKKKRRIRKDRETHD